MCERVGNLTRVCEKHLWEDIADAFAKFPELADIDPTGDDWFDAERVAEEYASRVHDAWGRVREARYLLGDD